MRNAHLFHLLKGKITLVVQSHPEFEEQKKNISNYSDIRYIKETRTPKEKKNRENRLHEQA